MIGFSGCGGVGSAAFDWRKERDGKQRFAQDVTERRAMMPVGARFFGRTDTFIIGSCRIDLSHSVQLSYFQKPSPALRVQRSASTFAGREGAASKGQHGRTGVISLFAAVLALSCAAHRSRLKFRERACACVALFLGFAWGRQLHRDLVRLRMSGTWTAGDSVDGVSIRLHQHSGYCALLPMGFVAPRRVQSLCWSWSSAGWPTRSRKRMIVVVPAWVFVVVFSSWHPTSKQLKW